MSEIKVQTRQEQTAYGKKKVSPEQKVDIPAEQLSYANLLLYGSWTGIALLTITFFIYVSGIMNPFIPPEQMVQYWAMSADKYIHAAGVPVGWGWLGLLGYGDFINYIGIALLGGLTIIGYLILLPSYMRSKDIPYTFIVITEIVVLVLAASGILGSGGH